MRVDECAAFPQEQPVDHGLGLLRWFLSTTVWQLVESAIFMNVYRRWCRSPSTACGGVDILFGGLLLHRFVDGLSVCAGRGGVLRCHGCGKRERW